MTTTTTDRAGLLAHFRARVDQAERLAAHATDNPRLHRRVLDTRAELVRVAASLGVDVRTTAAPVAASLEGSAMSVSTMLEQMRNRAAALEKQVADQGAALEAARAYPAALPEIGGYTAEELAALSPGERAQLLEMVAAARAQNPVGLAKVAQIMGMSVADVEFYSQFVFTHENGGTFIARTGERFTRAELAELHRETVAAPRLARLARNHGRVC